MRATVSEMRTRIGRNIGIIDDSSYNPKILGWMNEAYEWAWDKFLWPGSIIRGTVTTTVNQDFINFPPQVRRVFFLSQQVTPEWLRYSDSAAFVRTWYNELDSTSTGTPKDWTEDGESPVLAQPTSSSTLSISSASASDTSQSIRIHGRDSNNVLLTESVQLNGTSAQVSTKSYASIEMICKTASTVGIVTVTSNSGAVTVTRFAPTELDSKFVKARLHLIPDTAISIYYLAKKHPIKLVNDEDQLLIDIDDVIVAKSTGRALKEQGELADGQNWENEAESLLAARRDEILGQGMKTIKLRVDRDGTLRYNIRGSN